MVALRPVVSRRLRILHQPMLVDFQMRMRFAMGGSGYGLQHPHGSRQALPVLCPRLARTSGGDDRHHRAATLDNSSRVDLAHSRACRVGDVSHRGRARGIGSRVVGRVLEPVDLADPQRLRAYWNCLWHLNPLTYCSSQWSSGSPSKSSTAAEAAVAAVYPSGQSEVSVPPQPSRDHRERYFHVTKSLEHLTNADTKPSPDRQGGDIRCLKP
jgi:hypothetical protein